MITSHESLSVNNLTKIFKSVSPFTFKHTEFIAVNDVSFNLARAEILGLLGPNGAGKTTIIQMLLSVLVPTSGSINYFGLDFFNHRSEVLQHVAFASTYVKLPARLTVKENLDIYGRLYGLKAATRAERIERNLKFFGLWHTKDKEIGLLSAGQVTCVMIAKAFLANPAIVLLDEPTASLDPDIAHQVRQFILYQQQEFNVSILLTSHNMDEVTEVCDRVLVLKSGRIIADNSPERLAASVSCTKIHLTSQSLDDIIIYAQEKKIPYVQEKNSISLEVDEQDIANVLADLARKNITYSSISVDKPSLEDYFLKRLICS